MYEREFGSKIQFFELRAGFNVSAFHNVVKGAQRIAVLTLNGISQTILENADLENWGAEGGLAVNIGKGLCLFASGSLLDTKYTSYTSFAVIGSAPNQTLTPIDKSESNLVGLVREQFVVEADDEAESGFGRLTLNANYAWQGGYSQDERPFFALAGSGVGPSQLAGQHCARLRGYNAE